MEVRLIEKRDYEILCEYWKFWKFPPPPMEFLPNNGLGGLKIVIKDDQGTEHIACAGFLYETNSKCAWLEFVVSNPNIRDKKIRHEALEDLVRYLTVQAQQKGFGYVFSSLKSESLIKIFEQVGYSISNSKTSEVVIKL